MKNKKILLLIGSVLLASVLVAYYLKRKNSPKQPLFETVQPERKDIVQYVNASGTLKAKEEVTIGSLAAGRVIEIKADNNDFVKKDQILTILDDGINYSAVKKFTAFLDEAKANLAYYKNFYARQTELYKANQISQDQYEEYTRNLKDYEAKVTQAVGELEMRQQEYDNLFIKSPTDGVVIAKEVDLGQMITSRFQATVLYKIAKNLHIMEANVDVDEADVGLVKECQDATFTVDAFPKRKFHAKVKQIRYLAKIVDNVVTYATILDVENPDLKLRPGMTTNVDIKVLEAKNALCVPNKCLRINNIILENTAKALGYNVKTYSEADKKNDHDNIWVLRNKTFEQIKVEIGAKHGAYTQIITNDIKDTDQILSFVDELNKENILLKQLFAQPGTIGNNNRK